MKARSHRNGRINTIRPLTLASGTALVLALLGGCSSNEPPSALLPTGPQTAVTANVIPARYPTGSPHALLFAALNRYRLQCGFPAYTENLTLDRAAQAHSDYMVMNDAQVSDAESVTGKQFVGETYAKRAAHFGFPSSTTGVGGVANAYLSSRDKLNTEYVDGVLDGWLSGVYHAWIVASPLTELGVGWTKTVTNGNQQILANLTVSALLPMTGDLPRTFPCEGTLGVPFAAQGELPEPPHTHGRWGTPIAVSGNPNDVVRLTSGAMLDAAGNPVALEILDSSNDSNHELKPYMAVAYPTNALQPDTAYSVILKGTVNGVDFTRHFTFRTGLSVG